MLVRLRHVLIGPDGTLRFIWRAGFYFALATWIVSPLLDAGLAFLPALLHLGPGLTAGNLGFEAGKNLLTAFLCTGVFALYERRRIDGYGLAKLWLFRRQALDGAAAGILMTVFVVSSMLVLGGIQIRGLAGTGSALTRSALAWRLANICVGFAEEFYWRSYLQVTPWKAFGFWPAATIIALLFTADHYFLKQGGLQNVDGGSSI